MTNVEMRVRGKNVERLILLLAVLISAADAGWCQTQEEMDAVTKIMHAPQTKTSTLSFFAGYYFGQGDHSKALSYYTKMRDLYAVDFGPLSGRALWATSKMAQCLQLKDEPEKAKKLAVDCLSQIEHNEATKDESDYLELARKACSDVIAGKPVDAGGGSNLAQEEVKALAEVAAAEKQGAYSQAYAWSLIKLARLYRAEQKYAESARSFKAGIHIIDNMAGPLHPILEPILNEYSMVLDAIGNKAESTAMAARSREIANAKAGIVADPFAMHMQTGMTALRNKDTATAEKELTQACATAKSDREKVIALNALAQVQIIMGKLDQSEQSGKISLALQDKQHWENTLDYAGTLTNMGAIAVKRKSYDTAGKFFERSLTILEGLKLNDQSQDASKLMFMAITHMGLADVAKAKGNAAEAEKQMDLAKKAIVQHETVEKH